MTAKAKTSASEDGYDSEDSGGSGSEITHYCRTALSRPVVTPNGTPIPPPRNVETKIKRMESNRMGFAKKSMSLPSRQPKKSSAVISSHEDQVPIIKKASRSAAPSPTKLNITPEWQKDDIIGKNGIKCSLFATQYDVEEIRERAMRPTLGTDGEVVDAYLVKWEGYDSSDNTWEPVNSMKSQVPNIVAAFEKSLEKSGKGRTPRASKAAKAVATSSSQKSHSKRSLRSAENSEATPATAMSKTNAKLDPSTKGTASKPKK